jgi:cellulose synthase/poly-beta-1,6-N-acetylglucosamine synthase-like glycosyltransferase
VVVCFRNEAERLARYLPLILEQEYPDFEVVAVDDHSSDASAGVIAELQERFSNLRYLRPSHPTRPGKKDALTYGIHQARHDLLLLTDADCAPASKDWIGHMTAPLATDPDCELVLGYSPYRANATAVNRFQRLETTYTAFQYLGLAQRGLPYMGVGRNVAYRKAFFQRAGGLESHAHLAGGDDDLLISHHASAAHTAIVIDPAAWTISDPASSWGDYWRRKRRHVGVGIAYPLLPKLLIGGLAVSHLLFYGLALWLLLSGFQIPRSRLSGSSWVMLLIAARWVAVVWVYGWRSARKEDSSFPLRKPLALLLNIILFDIGLVAYYLLTAPALVFGAGRGGWR